MTTMDELLAEIRQNESGGNYNLTPQDNYAYPSSHASGAYQFEPSTWQQYTQASGIGTQYSEAYQAPPAVQDQVAAYAAQNGPGVNSSGLWGASAPAGGYPSVTSNSTLAEGPTSGGNPNLANYYDASTGTGSIPGSSATGAPSLLDQLMGASNPLQINTQAGAAASTSGTGWPLAIGVLPGLGTALNDWITGAENAVGTQVQNTFAQWEATFLDFFDRGFLFFLGVAIAIVALWRLMDPEGTSTSQFVKKVV